MKKVLFFCCAAAMALASCTTTTHTARTNDLPASFYCATVSDLDVSSSRVTVEYVPTKDVQRGGYANVKKAAIRKALGDKYDVLVEPEFVISVKRGFTSKVSKVVVSGRPANYKNFHSLGDKVWTDPVFRGAKIVHQGCK